MSALYSPVQKGRLLSLTTPLGSDVLIPTAISGSEALSELFEMKISMISSNAGITADSLLGKPVTLKISRPDAAPRAFNGIVAAFSAGGRAVSGHRRYQIVLRPKLWLLTLTADCRVFQNQSVVQIAETLLSEGTVSDFKKKGLTGTHVAREYCVQYNETDYDFLRRILAEEGIYFYFQHGDGAHTLVLSDSAAGYGDCGEDSVYYAPPLSGETISIESWNPGYRFVSGKAALTDYNFEQPASDLTSSTGTALSNGAFKTWEVFDYPGDYLQKGDGAGASRLRMEAVEAGYAVVNGAGAYRLFQPGGKFTLDKHEVTSEQGKSYVLASVNHEAEDNTHLGNAAGEPRYSNSFTALPAETLFRPQRQGARPLIPGPQTAIVVGPSGEEIYCDKYGRIRVQFRWDRLGKGDEKSSCWVRVSQMLAGPGWGSQFTPRVGMEVIVVFLEGDPDRPLVIGCAYNGTNAPPYSLPDNKTQSGFKTRSSKEGSATTFNELRFEDKKDSELFYIRAQKDYTREVENDDTLQVKHDQKITIKNDRMLTVEEGNDSTTISKGNHALTVSEGNDSAVVSKGNSSLTVSQGNASTDVKSGNYAVKLGSGNATLQCDGGSITLKAAQSITLKVGSNSLTISQTGIAVKGTQITLTGDAKVQVGGPMVNINGDGMVQVKGGIVTIN
ncbi:type VI secretion system Vgr family protein [Pseudochelatococcus contaminans]|uniref:Type VI secretion system secreted protein VgrG n=1 Tax=Pseudochelatococcus contaminans TaxID=1538103 RepID=A0A7W6EEC4_9HYPH|nr:type VI secretion system tip protein VgrG [Pseudochelatococcus contaminans]MBB3808158.1 type VI secretion system secreted protein VgrG [Pseudochelatococcus contaminans]